jgi:hypothetical protein
MLGMETQSVDDRGVWSGCSCSVVVFSSCSGSSGRPELFALVKNVLECIWELCELLVNTCIMHMAEQIEHGTQSVCLAFASVAMHGPIISLGLEVQAYQLQPKPTNLHILGLSSLSLLVDGVTNCVLLLHLRFLLMGRSNCRWMLSHATQTRALLRRWSVNG